MDAATQSLTTAPRRSIHRRATSVLVVLAIIAIWEGAKAAFAIPPCILPHLHEICGDCRRRGGRAELYVGLMAHNAAYTAWEAFVGFAAGGAAGLALAVSFAYSPPLERGLLPYLVPSPTG